jgi:hypothetical protein
MYQIKTKKFIIRKGEPDWKVWNRVNNYLFEIMQKKRKRPFQISYLKKQMIISLEIKKAER